MPTIDPLLRYKAKRDFSVSPEPAEGSASAGHALSFVVQKHWASSLHYDFRLELGGTLKSWAVPKNQVGKVFIDYLRNGLGASTICAWSARARPGLGISVPVAWSELGMLTAGDHWTVRTVHARTHQGNDPWKSYVRSARGLDASMKAMGFEPTRA